jgi:hypothetical protein
LKLEAILKLVALANDLAKTIPAVVEAVKGALSQDDEAKLKLALTELRAKNDASFDAVLASLKSKA